LTALLRAIDVDSRVAQPAPDLFPFRWMNDAHDFLALRQTIEEERQNRSAPFLPVVEERADVTL